MCQSRAEEVSRFAVKLAVINERDHRFERLLETFSDPITEVYMYFYLFYQCLPISVNFGLEELLVLRIFLKEILFRLTA